MNIRWKYFLIKRSRTDLNVAADSWTTLCIRERVYTGEEDAVVGGEETKGERKKERARKMEYQHVYRGPCIVPLFLSCRFFQSPSANFNPFTLLPSFPSSSFKLCFPPGIFRDFDRGRKRKGRRSVKSNSANIRGPSIKRRTTFLKSLLLERQYRFSIIVESLFCAVFIPRKEIVFPFFTKRLVSARNTIPLSFPFPLSLPLSLLFPVLSLFLLGEFRICILYDMLRSYVSRFRYAICRR